MTRLAIFASGTGSNARKIIEHFQNHTEVTVSLVLSNKTTAPVLEMAAQKGIDTFVFNRQQFYNSAIVLEKLQEAQIDFIILAGFMWLVPNYLVDAFPNKIVNIHPALLPKYGGKGMYGMHVHRAVKAASETTSGITIHYVNAHYDEGQIIFQASCPILPADEPEDIARKVQQLEHQHFPLVIEQLVTAE